MIHSDLIFTLVIAIVAAFTGGFIANRIGLPPLVGYLLAGLVIGPNSPGGHADAAIASELAEVGVILLMFGVGLHFSLKDLMAVKNIAVPGALVQITVATVLATGLALWWGWSLESALVLGLALSVASTVVLLRAMEDLGLLHSMQGHIAVGWLIVEDLFTVVVLVMLPALVGPSGDASGLAALVGGDNVVLAVAFALVQAGIFVVLMLVVGVKAVPALLQAVANTGSRELFTLCVLAIALGIAFGSAELFGASLALGAFLAGVVLNESDLSHRAGEEAMPLRDAFAVLFFLSVGMLFDPSILVDEPLRVISVVLVVTVGKGLAAFAIVYVLGYGSRAGMTISASLAQVGEFSFILAALGLSLDVFSQEGLSLILAASMISITINPLLFRQVDRLESLFERRGWLRARSQLVEREGYEVTV